MTLCAYCGTPLSERRIKQKGKYCNRKCSSAGMFGSNSTRRKERTQEIRDRIRAGESQSNLATEYGITKQRISQIKLDAIPPKPIQKPIRTRTQEPAETILAPIKMTPDPWAGGIMKRQWRKLRGLLVGLKQNSPWIILEFPESDDVRRVVGVIHTLSWSSNWIYREFVFKTKRDRQHPTWLYVRRID